MVAESLHIHYPVLLSQGLCELYINLLLAGKETERGLKYFDFCPEFVITEMEPNLLHCFLQEILCVCSLNHSSLLVHKAEDIFTLGITLQMVIWFPSKFTKTLCNT